MQVAVLQQFLRSLVPALEAAGDGRIASDVAGTLHALEPFRSLSVADFAIFLGRANAYRADGVVREPGPGELQAERALEALAGLLGSTDDISNRQIEVANALESLAEQAGLKGSLKPDRKWAEARELKARVAPHLKSIVELAARIVSPDVYEEPNIKEGIQQLAGRLDAATLKALGSECEVKVGSKPQATKVLGDILAKLTGHQPPKAKKTKAPPTMVDPAIVDENARRLGSLVSLSSDPDAVPEAEAQAELAMLKKLKKATLFEVIVRAGIEGARSGDSSSAMLERVYNRLTAARRARERAEV